MTITMDATPARPSTLTDVCNLMPGADLGYTFFKRDVALLIGGRAAKTELALQAAENQLSALGFDLYRTRRELLPVFADESTDHVPAEALRDLYRQQTTALGLPEFSFAERYSNADWIRVFKTPDLCETEDSRRGLFRAAEGPFWWLSRLGLSNVSSGADSPLEALLSNHYSGLLGWFFPESRERLKAGDTLRSVIQTQVAQLKQWTGHPSVPADTHAGEAFRRWKSILRFSESSETPVVHLTTAGLGALKALPHGQQFQVDETTALLTLPVHGLGSTVLLLRDGQLPLPMSDEALNASWIPDGADIAAAQPALRLDVNLYSYEDDVVCDLDVHTEQESLRSEPHRLNVTADPSVFWLTGTAQCYRADPARIARVVQAAEAYRLLRNF